MTDTNDLSEDEFIFETIFVTEDYIGGFVHNPDGTPITSNVYSMDACLDRSDHPELPADEEAWYAVRGTMEGGWMIVTQARPFPDALRVKLNPVVEAFHKAANWRWRAEYIAEQAAA